MPQEATTAEPQATVSKLDARQLQMLKSVPKKYKTLHLKAITGEATARQAIKAKCYGCMGWEGDWQHGRTLTQEVDQCKSTVCELHPYRPRLKGNHVA